MRRWVVLALVAFEAFWTVVVLPGHVRGVLTLDGRPPACCAAEPPACCGEKSRKPAPSGRDRKSQCALCNNARAHVPAPVLAFDVRPTGLLELCRLIEPTRLHRLLCRPTYDATAPPAILA